MGTGKCSLPRNQWHIQTLATLKGQSGLGAPAYSCPILSPPTLPTSLVPLYCPGKDTVVVEGLQVGTGSNIKETQSILTENMEENQWPLMRFYFLHNEQGWG